MLPNRAQLKHARHLIEQITRIPLVLLGTGPIECPLCGYKGRFLSAGYTMRLDSMCPGCGSAERHRLLALVEKNVGLFDVDSLLHFAPEEIIRSRLSKRIKRYETTDLSASGVSFHCNIEDTKLPSDSYDAVLAIHVLEHVDDVAAMKDLLRILKPGGRLIAMVPMIDGWPDTWADPAIVSPEDRLKYYGHPDHVRYFGRDFIERMRSCGFETTDMMATPRECVQYGLIRGDHVFVGRKPH